MTDCADDVDDDDDDGDNGDDNVMQNIIVKKLIKSNLPKA